MSSDELESLREALRQGDPEAFRGLVRLMSEPMFRYVRPMLGDDSLAQDVVQQTYINLYRSRARLTEHGSLRGLCFMIAINLVRDEKRRSHVRQEREAAAMELAMRAQPSSDTSGKLLAIEAFEAAKRLPEELREVVLLRFGQGLTAGETALALGVPEGTVRTRQRAALDKLREKLLATAPVALIDDPKLELALHQGSKTLVPVPQSLVANVEALVMASIGTKVGISAGVLILTLLILLGGVGTIIGIVVSEDRADSNAVASGGGADVRQPGVDGSNESKGVKKGKRDGRNTTSDSAANSGAKSSGAENGAESDAGASGVEQVRRMTVRGRVMDSTSQQPVAGALVEYMPWNDDKPSSKTVTNENGEFELEITGERIDVDLDDLRVSKEGYTATKTYGLDADALKLLELEPLEPVVPPEPESVVVVRMEGTGCLPESAWIFDESNPAKEGVDRPAAYFSGATKVARIVMVGEAAPKGACRVRAQWMSKLLESEPFVVKRGATTEVVLSTGDGASINVRVLGVDSLPLANVPVWVKDYDMLVELRPLWGRTNAQGEVLFTGLAAGHRLWVDLGEDECYTYAITPQFPEITSQSDFINILFDMSGYGIVHCEFTAGGKRLTSLHIVALNNDGSMKDDEDFHSAGLEVPESAATRDIYGLKPQRYSVSSGPYSATFDVKPGPAVTNWIMDFKSYRVVVKVSGADAAKLTLMITEPFFKLLQAEESGDFIIETATPEILALRIFGAEKASRILHVDPTKITETSVELLSAGRVKFLPRDAKANVDWLRLSGLDPVQPPMTLRYDYDKIQVTESLLLPPGRYVIEPRMAWGAPWDPTEFEVHQGEETICSIGPSYTSTVIVTTTNHTEVWSSSVTLTQDRRTIRVTALRGGLAAENNFYFEAHGKLILRIEVDGYEPIEREIEIERGGKVKLEIELKRKP